MTTATWFGFISLARTTPPSTRSRRLRWAATRPSMAASANPVGSSKIFVMSCGTCLCLSGNGLRGLGLLAALGYQGGAELVIGGLGQDLLAQVALVGGADAQSVSAVVLGADDALEAVFEGHLEGFAVADHTGFQRGRQGGVLPAGHILIAQVVLHMPVVGVGHGLGDELMDVFNRPVHAHQVAQVGVQSDV